jgi:hypothetical protein
VTIYAPGVSPYVYRAFDPAGYVLKVTFSFDNATRAIHDATVEREPGCSYDRLLTGVASDGSPTVLTRAWEIPEGQSLIPENDLHSRNIHDIDDLFFAGITAASAACPVE